jgi:alpha-L-rhamnosidase
MLKQIFEAARQTYRQNAVDIFMDCPSRERAGWLCDSFWSARTGHLLSGHQKIETAFLENYALPQSFAFIPD